VFHYGGQTLKTVVPPTYFDCELVSSNAKLQLEAAHGKGSTFVPAFLPSKLVAVLSGLARYGRNNIAYTPEFGSFFRITTFFSDVEPNEDSWGDMGILKECKGCRICTMACPANVFEEGRFLARADRCLTYHNEKPSTEPFPSWINPLWHNSIIGCMIC
jgi:epoxyqueuosine reductase